MGHQRLDRRDVADDHHGLARPLGEHPVEGAEDPLLDRAERLAVTARHPVEGADPAVEVGLVRRRDLRERQPVPGAELHLGEAWLFLDGQPEPFGEDVGRLPGAAYRRRDQRVDALRSGASQSAVARTWSRPSSLRPGLALASPPEKRFSAVSGVTP